MKCFREEFGELLARRRCWYCATDDAFREEWGGWRVAGGHLACGQCANRVEIGQQHFVRSHSLYRARSAPNGARRIVDVYYHLKHFKENLEQLSYLAVPLGNCVAKSAAALIREEAFDLPEVLLVAAPPSSPERRHMQRMLEQVKVAISAVEVAEDALQSVDVAESKKLGLSDRSDRPPPAVTVPVDGRIVIVCDDIYTTGTGLLRSAEALLGAGAKGVYGATVARIVSAPPDSVFGCGENCDCCKWKEISNTGFVGVRLPIEEVCFRLGCDACPGVAGSPAVSIEPDEEFVVAASCPCGREHDLRVVAHKNYGFNLQVEGSERRPSEVIYHIPGVE